MPLLLKVGLGCYILPIIYSLFLMIIELFIVNESAASESSQVIFQYYKYVYIPCLCLMIGIFLYKLITGYNWARVVISIFIIMDLLDYFYIAFNNELEIIPIEESIITALHLFLLIVLYAPSTNAWFSMKKIERLVPKQPPYNESQQSNRI